MADLRQQVIAVTSPYVNAFIVRDRKSIIVDTGLPGFGEKILQAVEEHDIKYADISLIIITHGHDDHYGSAAFLKSRIGAPLAVGSADAQTLRTAASAPLHPVGTKGKVMEMMSRMIKVPGTEAVEPDIVIDSEVSLADYGVAGKIILIPGHTMGSLGVMLDDRSILIGDLIFGGLLRPKAPGFPYFCEDVPALMKSIQKVLDLNPSIMYAAHGGPFTPEAVKRKFFG